MFRHYVIIPLLCVFLASCSSAKEATQNKAQALLSQQTISLNTHDLLVEVAINDIERHAGLAHRKHLDTDSGMLFVYKNSKTRYFTTAQTTLALSIAFIDQSGVIVDIQKMQPLNEVSYKSKFKARYVLEVNQGWFERHNVKVGDLALSPEIISKYAE